MQAAADKAEAHVNGQPPPQLMTPAQRIAEVKRVQTLLQSHCHIMRIPEIASEKIKPPGQELGADEAQVKLVHVIVGAFFPAPYLSHTFTQLIKALSSLEGLKPPPALVGDENKGSAKARSEQAAAALEADVSDLVKRADAMGLAKALLEAKVRGRSSHLCWGSPIIPAVSPWLWPSNPHLLPLPIATAQQEGGTGHDGRPGDAVEAAPVESVGGEVRPLKGRKEFSQVVVAQ